MFVPPGVSVRPGLSSMRCNVTNVFYAYVIAILPQTMPANISLYGLLQARIGLTNVATSLQTTDFQSVMQSESTGGSFGPGQRTHEQRPWHGGRPQGE